MLCLPAFAPVANDAHAVGDSGECVVSSGCRPPCAASFLKLGSFPSPIHFLTSAGSIPSKPRMTSFCWNRSGGRDRPQAAAVNPRYTANRKRERFTVVLGDNRKYSIEKVGHRVLGIDYGERRIGLAISDATRTLARPLTTLVVSDQRDALARVTSELARL